MYGNWLSSSNNFVSNHQENVILGSDSMFPLAEHHPGKLIEDMYKDDLELKVKEQSHSVSRLLLLLLFFFCH